MAMYKDQGAEDPPRMLCSLLKYRNLGLSSHLPPRQELEEAEESGCGEG